VRDDDVKNILIDIVQNPRINGNNLPPKYQLKQELYLDFTNFKNLCYTALITYQ